MDVKWTCRSCGSYDVVQTEEFTEQALAALVLESHARNTPDCRNARLEATQTILIELNIRRE